MSSAEPVYLVDSSIYVFRGWFTMPDSIRGPGGEAVNAVYGFSEFVRQLLQQADPQLIAFAFDESLTTSKRNDIYPAYKANREPAPEELKRQFAWCRELVAALGLAQFGSDRAEADDLIATLAHLAHEAGHPVVVVTSDKDLTQLIQTGDIWWDFARDQRLDEKGVLKKHGVHPHQVADLLALAGDKVDNIPGVPGIGPATAAKLLTRWGDLDNLWHNLQRVGSMKMRGARRVQQLLELHRDTVTLSRRLTGLEQDLPVVDGLDALRRRRVEPGPMQQVFTRLGFSKGRRAGLEKLLGDPDE